MTATSKKKKEYLKERKIKKKLAKNGGADAYREVRVFVSLVCL